MVVRCRGVTGDIVCRCWVWLMMIVSSHVGAAQIEFELMGAGLKAVLEVFCPCCAWRGVLTEVERTVAWVGCRVLMLVWKASHVWVGLRKALRKRCSLEVVYAVMC